MLCSRSQTSADERVAVQDVAGTKHCHLLAFLRTDATKVLQSIPID